MELIKAEFRELGQRGDSMAADDVDRATAHAIGQIEGTIAGFKNTLEHFANTWAEQDRQATTGRRELYRKIDEMSRELAQVGERVKPLAELWRAFEDFKARVNPIIDTVERIEPIVATLDAAHNKTAGAASASAIVGKGLWALTLIAVTALLTKVGWK